MFRAQGKTIRNGSAALAAASGGAGKVFASGTWPADVPEPCGKASVASETFFLIPAGRQRRAERARQGEKRVDEPEASGLWWADKKVAYGR